MSYESIHEQLKRENGPAHQHLCSCGSPARDWAYQHTGKELTDPATGRVFSEDPDDYHPMCRSCHTLLDRQHDPKWDQTIREHARQMGERERTFEEQSRLGKLGIAAAAPKLAEHRQALAVLNHTAQRRCSCGRVFNRTGLGRHQQVSGHQGYEDLS